MDGEQGGTVPKRSTDEEAIRAIKHVPAGWEKQRSTSQPQCTLAKKKQEEQWWG
jgi:hypothetical protein